MSAEYKILKIEITSFGKLKNVVLTPGEHINLISMPNESGKTTLAAFLKYIFYGFTGTKKQSITENEKLRYMPWDGSAAMGAVVIHAKGKTYRISRKTDGKEDSLTVTDVDTGENALQGLIPGVAIFGIGESTFTKTLFVGRAGEAHNGDPALAEALRNLLFSADEKTNADKAMKRLKEGRAYLKNMQYRGVIPTLEDKCSKLEEALDKANAVHKELTSKRVALCDKRELLAKTNGELDAINAELENLRCFEAGQRLEEIYAAKESYTEAQQKYEDARAALGGKNAPETQLIDALADDNANLTLSTKRLDELSAELSAAEDELLDIKTSSPFFDCDVDEVKSDAKRKKYASAALLTVGGILTVAGFLLILLKSTLWSWLAAMIPGVILLILAAVFAVKGRALAQELGYKNISELLKSAEEFAVLNAKARTIEDRVTSLNRRYSEEALENRRLSDSVGSRVNEFIPGQTDGYSASIKKIYSAASEIGACKAEWIHSANIYKKLSENVDISELAELAKKAEPPKRPRNEVERELTFTQSRLKAINDAVTELEKQCAYLDAQSESPAILSGRLEVTERKLDEARLQYRALSLAMEVLEDSCNFMKSTVSPKLAELTGGYLDIASGGKYSTVGLTANLEMSYDDNGMEHSADHLSDGARDTAYLSMRFALTELIYDSNRPFMLLDDSFCHLDETRLDQMLHLIAGLSESQQIFLLCCRDRERSRLDQTDIPYTLLTLDSRT